MKRQAVKRWRNGPEDKATTRITWYSLMDGSDIRLILEDSCVRNVEDLYPPTKEEAERVFNLFRMFSPSLASNLSSLGVIDRVKEYLSRNPSPEPVEVAENASSIAASMSSAITLGITPTPGPDEPSDTLGASTAICAACRGILQDSVTDKRLYLCECPPVPGSARRYIESEDPHAEQMAHLACLLQNPAVKGDERDILKNRLQRLHTPLTKITEDTHGASN